MKSYKYLIVGGGMTGDAAARGIRQVDRKGTIGMIGDESHAPYDRPPLTKGLWKGKGLGTIWRKTKNKGVTLHLGRTVKKIDPGQKRVVDDKGNIFKYEKLLLATGGRPKLLPFGEDKIIYYRTLSDYQHVRALTEKGQRFAVIGAGFVGSEIAAGLALNGKKVTMIFPGKSIGDGIFPRGLSQFVSKYYKQKGVALLPKTKASGLETNDKKLVLKLSGKRKITVDGMVAGLGIEPNVELAKKARLKVADGVVVDAFLRTSHADIYAAGDVASFYNPALGKRVRIEHEDNANTMGLFAGRNMAGMSEPYNYLPFFYSDLFDLGYEAVGELNPRLKIFADWKRLNKEGVIYYLRNARVRGVLLWNVWNQVDAARALIAAPGRVTPKDLKGRLK